MSALMTDVSFVLPGGLPDKRQVAASFSRAAASYDSVAEFQREVGTQLLERLPASSMPSRWLDLGCGTGYFTRALAARFTQSSGVALDIAEGMLNHARPLGGAEHFIAGDAERLPLQDASLELIFSSLALQWCADFDAVLSDAQRRSIIFELPAVDVMGDLATFLAVADGVRRKGYRLCLDGLSPFTMPYFRLQDLNFDLFKIAWSSELVEEYDADHHTLLQGVVMRCGADRMILCHCDSEHALRFGQQFGISLYQGRLLDQLLKVG